MACGNPQVLHMRIAGNFGPKSCSNSSKSAKQCRKQLQNIFQMFELPGNCLAVCTMAAADHRARAAAGCYDLYAQLPRALLLPLGLGALGFRAGPGFLGLRALDVRTWGQRGLHGTTTCASCPAGAALGTGRPCTSLCILWSRLLDRPCPKMHDVVPQ